MRKKKKSKNYDIKGYRILKVLFPRLREKRPRRRTV